MEVLDSPCGAVGVARRAVAQRPWQASGPGWGQTDFYFGPLGPQVARFEIRLASAGLGAGRGPNGFYFGPLGAQMARNKIRLAASRPWGLPRLLGPLRGPPSALLGRSWRARVRACVHAQGWAIHACVALACFPNSRLRPDRLRRAPAFRITDRARIAHCGRIVLVHGLSDYGLF